MRGLGETLEVAFITVVVGRGPWGYIKVPLQKKTGSEVGTRKNIWVLYLENGGIITTRPAPPPGLGPGHIGPNGPGPTQARWPTSGGRHWIEQGGGHQVAEPNTSKGGACWHVGRKIDFNRGCHWAASQRVHNLGGCMSWTKGAGPVDHGKNGCLFPPSSGKDKVMVTVRPTF